MRGTVRANIRASIKPEDFGVHYIDYVAESGYVVKSEELAEDFFDWLSGWLAVEEDIERIVPQALSGNERAAMRVGFLIDERDNMVSDYVGIEIDPIEVNHEHGWYEYYD